MFRITKRRIAVTALLLAGTACQIPTGGEDERVAAPSSRPTRDARAISDGGAIGSGNRDAASDSTTAISGGGAIGSGNREGGGAIGSGN